jgi:hypothetical protein
MPIEYIFNLKDFEISSYEKLSCGHGFHVNWNLLIVVKCSKLPIIFFVPKISNLKKYSKDHYLLTFMTRWAPVVIFPDPTPFFSKSGIAQKDEPQAGLIYAYWFDDKDTHIVKVGFCEFW